MSHRLEELEAIQEHTKQVLLHYREFFEYTSDAYLVTDRAGIILEVNQAAAILLHRSKEFLLGKPLPFYVVAEQRADFYMRLAWVTSMKEVSQTWEAHLNPHIGRYLDVVLTVVPMQDNQGRPRALRWIIQDITSRKVAERILQTEQNFTDRLIEAVQALVLLCNSQGQLVRTNAYLESVTGYNRDELSGIAWFDRLLSIRERPKLWHTIQQALASGESTGTIVPISTREGRRRLIAWLGKRLPQTVGDSTVVLLVGHDITELHEAQRQSLQFERLAAIGHMATGLAHESRNAIQRGLACLERLRWKLQDQPELLDLVYRAQAAQEDLLRLYENVREYAAPFEVETQPCNLVEIWRDTWTELLSLAPGRHATLQEDPPDEHWICDVDRFRMRQVFRNLLENALAACADPVCIRISCQETELAGRSALRIAIRDNGPGLTSEQREHLFEPFYTTKIKGTGLGLAIVKRIVGAHGGQIAVGETTCPGTEIIITLPWRRP